VRDPFASRKIVEVAGDIGARVELEPEFGFVGEIVFANGKRHLFRNTNFNINPAGSVEIAKDKSYTSYFLAKHGFRVPVGRTFFSPRLLLNLRPAKRRGLEDACAYAKERGYPVIAKPNDLSQGKLVCKVCTDDELRAVGTAIFEETEVLLIEDVCKGRDYRIVVLGAEVVSA